MESSAIQLRLILTSVAFGISMSCNIRSNDPPYSSDSIATERRSDSSDKGLPDKYSALSYRNGVISNSKRALMDSVLSPIPILESIQNDSLLKSEEIIKRSKKLITVLPFSK